MVISWIIWIWAFVYAGFTLLILYGLRRIDPGRSSVTPKVSVVVAARNEAANIGRCIESLRAQDYDPGLYEVIVADDRSTDGTSDILRDRAASWHGLRVLRIDRTPGGVSPKKHALSTAIAAATGDIILQTDADCAVPTGWISGMARAFEPGVGFVAGIAPYREGSGPLNSFIRHEYLWNAALAAASIALGHGNHASGRNMGFRRDVFAKLGGYGEFAGVLSGDDTLLLHRIRRSHIARAAIMPSLETHVETDAPATFVAFLHQRARHLSTGRLFDPALLAIGGIVYGFHLALVASLVLAPFSRTAFTGFAGGFLIRCAADALVARRVERALSLDIQWGRFVLNEAFLILYMAAMPIVSNILPVHWKDAAGKKKTGAGDTVITDGR
jgi:cellulose synthase/poly-beta-1,6-N-acetylglucosamine synthase-like glycosyltransferase